MGAVSWAMLFALAGDDNASGEGARARRSEAGDGFASSAASLSPEDTELVSRVRSGDLEVFRTLYLRTYDSLVGFASALTVSRADAEEVVQDVFAAVWERRTTWTPVRSVASYLFAAVRNRSSKVRAHGAVVARAERDVEGVTSLASGELPVQPDVAVEVEDLRRAVSRAVALLPKRRRLALALRFGEGMSYAEIGDVLGVSEHAATLLVARAREAIAPVLTPFRRG